MSCLYVRITGSLGCVSPYSSPACVQPVDQLDLVGLVREQRLRASVGADLALSANGCLPADDLAHALLDRRQVLGR